MVSYISEIRHVYLFLGTGPTQGPMTAATTGPGTPPAGGNLVQLNIR